MGAKRKHHSEAFKAKVALEAVKGVGTLSGLASRYRAHPTRIAQWKRQLLENAPLCFERGRNGAGLDPEALTAPLCQGIGRLKMEVDFLQEKS